MYSIEDISEKDYEFLRESIRTEILAFPGCTVSMYHARLTVKRGQAWRSVLQDLIERGEVREEAKLVNGRGVAVLYWMGTSPDSEAEVHEVTVP